eukprot:CAMPEP_0115306438 /NCGR_PEP_ID=MMETSP0270-20121206/72583_1 /TAXON_ID=71861 /ORGANISM="Scrippsiella trochoidea, Strain CCMP3099" /LENGTH=34 /DNA_ID= /DNA_START= /DNA_END= /DNA_ORIENTATION=
MASNRKMVGKRKQTAAITSKSTGVKSMLTIAQTK